MTRIGRALPYWESNGCPNGTRSQLKRFSQIYAEVFLNVTLMLFFSVTGISFEMIQKAGFDFPHIAYGQCLASHRTSYGSFNWINLDCNRELQFVCQERMCCITT